MDKRWIIIFALLLVGLNAYASGNSHKQSKALAASVAETRYTAEEQPPMHMAGMATHSEQQEDHMSPETIHAGDGHAADHMAGDHGVPATAAAVSNPIAASDESINRGAALFSQSCASCHGATGEGDGPGAAALDPKPADLHADHVQGNSDGALFWIISQGREGTAMPAWNSTISEEDRWHLVNFLRTFSVE